MMDLLTRKPNPRSFGTHDGTFHADEVTACAFLLLFDLIDVDQIHRSRNPELLAKCEYVCDVGGFYDPEKKLFDHHQIDYQGPLSSAGMVLEDLFHTGFLEEWEFFFFRNNLVDGVDALDNGRDLSGPGVCSFSHIISNFNPIEHDSSPGEQETAFQRALSFTFGHLNRMRDRAQYVHSCEKTVAETMASSTDCLIFEKSLPWQEGFFARGGEHHPARFVIMPAGPHWKLRGIPPTLEEKMKVRLPLPEEWGGLLDEELKKVSGIPGAVFCHKGLFVSVWETKDDAMQALEYTLGKEKEKK